MLKLNRKKFQQVVWNYYRAHGRNLPWRPLLLKLRKDKSARNPYHILVSEIMLQQTRASRVEGKYHLFLKEFPDFRTLAVASTREVLSAWQGMGYNRRALALKRIAEQVMKEYKGALPRNPGILETFPGIGKGTAGSIAAFAFNMPVPFIETNIRRVFIHFFFPKRRKVHDEEIMKLVERTLDMKNPREWYYALMDYGAMLGKQAKENPNRKSVHYRKQAPFEGSLRQVRGRILQILVRKKHITHSELADILMVPKEKMEKALAQLVREGFVEQHGRMVQIRT